jgi:hypothetical protein
MNRLIREATEIELQPKTWAVKMGLISAGHGNRSSTLSEHAGSIRYSAASPQPATRPSSIILSTAPSPTISSFPLTFTCSLYHSFPHLTSCVATMSSQNSHVRYSPGTPPGPS